MPGAGGIGGGTGSAIVEFSVGKNKSSLNDHDAHINETKITVTFPQDADLKPKGPKKNEIEVVLHKGDTVTFKWRP